MQRRSANMGLNKTGMAPKVIIEPIKANDAANDLVRSDNTPPMTGPIRLEIAWNNRINPYEDPIRSTPEKEFKVHFL